MTKFFHFSQNNSFGVFRKPAKEVFIEAETYEEANKIAKDLGLYFDTDFEIDCRCCGSRWYEQEDWCEAMEFPKLYGKSIQEYLDSLGERIGKYVPEILVHYKNGIQEIY